MGESSHLDELDEWGAALPTELMGVTNPPTPTPDEVPMNFAVDESEGLLCSKVMRLRVYEFTNLRIYGLAAFCSTTKNASEVKVSGWMASGWIAGEICFLYVLRDVYVIFSIFFFFVFWLVEWQMRRQKLELDGFFLVGPQKLIR